MLVSAYCQRGERSLTLPKLRGREVGLYNSKVCSVFRLKLWNFFPKSNQWQISLLRLFLCLYIHSRIYRQSNRRLEPPVSLLQIHPARPGRFPNSTGSGGRECSMSLLPTMGSFFPAYLTLLSV